MAEDRYLEDGAGRTSAQEEPQDHTATILFYPEADRNEHRTLPSFLPSFLPVVGRVADRAVTSFQSQPSPQETRPFPIEEQGKRRRRKKTGTTLDSGSSMCAAEGQTRSEDRFYFFLFPDFSLLPLPSWLSFRFSCICSTLLTVSLKPASTGEEETLRFTGLSWKWVFLDEYRIVMSEFFLFLSFF